MPTHLLLRVIPWPFKATDRNEQSVGTSCAPLSWLPGGGAAASLPQFPSGRQGPHDEEFHQDMKGIIRVEKWREGEREEVGGGGEEGGE